VALSVEYVANRQFPLQGFIRWLRPVWIYLQESFVFRVVLPFLILTFFGALAQEPKNIVPLTSWVTALGGGITSEFAEEHRTAIQFIAILIGFLIGKPLLSGAWRFIREKWAP
jgi:hypothetical protein